MRPWLFGLTLPLIINGRHLSILVVVVATVVGVALARSKWTAACVGVLGALSALGVPWIITPLAAGALLLLSRRHREQAKRGPGRVTVGVLVGIAVGLLAGLLAVPFVRAQVSVSPLAVTFSRPSRLILWVGVVGLAAANAVGEELVWRLGLASELASTPHKAALAVQAVSFGAAHWFGLPGGAAGLVLAAAFGTAATWISHRWSIRESILAHFLADLFIFAAVLPWIQFAWWARPR